MGVPVQSVWFPTRWCCPGPSGTACAAASRASTPQPPPWRPVPCASASAQVNGALWPVAAAHGLPLASHRGSSPSHWRQRTKPGLFEEQDSPRPQRGLEPGLAQCLWQIVLSVCGVSWGLGDRVSPFLGRLFAKLQAGWRPGRVGSGHLRPRGCPPSPRATLSCTRAL